ncbi:MAG: DsbA family protein [Anaerolineae bacterium]|nr:DsbA family protein [Anaerolineae bacterium]
MSNKSGGPSQMRHRPVERRQGITTAQIALVIGAVVVAVALLIVLNSSRLRRAAGVVFTYPTGVTQDGSPYKGAPEAPLKLELYSDFLCGHCADFANVLEAISKDYIETGKLQVIFRNFAFLTPESVRAAEASLCALDQSPASFWQYHDLLYASRGGGIAAYTTVRLKAYAQELGLDTQAFNRCLDSRAKAAQIQADLDAGRQAGVDGTPTWFLNDQKHVGAMSEGDLRQLLDSLLSK